MMYADTSVLVAYYCPEQISNQIEEILIKIGRPAISQLTEVELTSALARKTRERTLSKEDAKAVLSLFYTHMDENSFVYLPILPKHFSAAQRWIAEFDTSLRTLDALHLAIAAQSKSTLLTADAKLAESAERKGIEVRLVC